MQETRVQSLLRELDPTCPTKKNKLQFYLRINDEAVKIINLTPSVHVSIL